MKNGRRRSLTKEQYVDLWHRLSKGESAASIARSMKISGGTMSEITRGDIYVDWLSAVDRRVISKAIAQIKKRANPTQKVIVESECRPAVPWLSLVRAKEAAA